MVNIFLIRHGKASSGWNSLDPSLDNEGERQSREVSKKLLNYSSKDFDIYNKNLFSTINNEEKRVKLMKAIDYTNIKYVHTRYVTYYTTVK